MNGWTITPLDAAPRVVTGDARPPLSHAVAGRVRAQWDAATAARPGLYDGRIFTATHIAADTITGTWCPYSHALTQMREPTLFAELGLRPLAVTALLLCPEGAVLGQRNADSVYQPGFWQGVPAGSVESRSGEDAVDLHAQLKAEFLEELGLDDTQLTIGRAHFACEHPGTHIVDIAYGAHTALGFAGIEAGWRARGNAEYTALRLIPRPAFAEVATEPDILPTTVAMLRAMQE